MNVLLFHIISIFCITALFHYEHMVTCLLDEDGVKFVVDYFMYKNIRELLVVGCSNHETFLLTKCCLSTTAIWVILPSVKDTYYIPKQTYYKYGIFLNHDCFTGKQWLIKSSENYLLNTSYYWLVWGKDVFEIANKLNLSVDSEFVWSYKDSFTGTIFLRDIHKVNYLWSAAITPAGYWNIYTGLHYDITLSKYERRKNLQGLTLKAGLALNNIPYENVKEELVKPENRQRDSMATFNYAAYLFLMQQFNFSVNLTLTHLFGYVVENGRYEGLVKLIGDGEVDLHVSGLFISPQRYKHMDYTVNTWKFRSGFIFRHPPVTDGLDALLQPFSYPLWICASIMWICIMVILACVSRFHIQNASQGNKDNVPWSDAFLTIMSTVGQQGVTIQSTQISWRTVFWVLQLATLMIDTYYASSIVFSLITDPKKTIRTTHDLIDSNLKIGAENISYNVALFEINDDPLIRKLFTKKMLKSSSSEPEYYSLEKGVKKVLRENFAFHVELLKIYPTIERVFPEEKKCALTEIVTFTPEYTYIPVRWGSPYKKLITLGLRRATECGLLNYLNRLWRPQLPTCFLPGSEVVPVGIHTVTPAFGILLLGIISALVMLYVERHSNLT